MDKIYTIEFLRICEPVYQHLLNIPRYNPDLEEQSHLKHFKHLFNLGKFDNDELVQSSEFDLELVGYLVGYVSI